MLGLFHTFEGLTCDAGANGDFVDDTVQQDEPSGGGFSCPASIDFCPNLHQPVYDASNIMDYSSCQEKFTPGQSVRMYEQVNLFRRVLEGCPPGLIEILVSVDLSGDPTGGAGFLTVWDRVQPFSYLLYNASFYSYINYASETLSGRICTLPGVYQINFIDSANTVIGATLSLNERSVPSSPTDKSIFFYTEANDCQHYVVLNIRFADSPRYINWKFQDDDGGILLQDSATFQTGASVYNSGHADSSLHVGVCLENGKVVFSLTNEAFSENPTMYQLDIGGKFFESVVSSTSPMAMHTFMLGPTGSVVLPNPPSPPMVPPVAPTPSPSAPFSSSVCFSSKNTVTVLNKGPISIEALEIGDYVQMPAGNGGMYSRVYAFAHKDPTTVTLYRQIRVGADQIELSDDHLLFVNNDTLKRAKDVEVGDLVGKERVDTISMVHRRGLYAPLTESGVIVVSGVPASNYVALLAAVNPAIQVHVFHSVLAPLRLFCSLDGETCKLEEYHEAYSSRIFWLIQVVETIAAFNTSLQLVVIYLGAVVLSPMPWLFAVGLVFCYPLLATGSKVHK